VTTNLGTHEADILVVAMVRTTDTSATSGVVLGRNEFYSLAGAAHMAGVLPGFSRGHAVIGVCAAPYKCPPAPSECA
jgi:sulfide:quinone oxidoreductase